MVLGSLLVLQSCEGCPCSTGHTVCVGGTCKSVNDGTMACTDVSDCADSSARAICTDTCKCAAGYRWTYYYNKCLLPNDDSTGTCHSDGECMDQGDYGNCYNNKCHCSGSCNWASNDVKCCSKNNGGFCLADKGCFDQINGGCGLSGCVCNGEV